LRRSPSAGRWHSVVCIASGPSLTADDCEKARAWRSQGRGRAVVVTNTTFQLCPWADALYAMDRAWWNKYRAQVAAGFRGECLTSAQNVPGAKTVIFRQGGNSGAGAMSLAEHFGARRIILLGYDCQYTGGKAHWHGNHPKGLGNAASLPKWQAQFAEMAGHLAHCHIINCSRHTALPFWPRQRLE